jgi:predicted permease
MRSGRRSKATHWQIQPPTLLVRVCFEAIRILWQIACFPLHVLNDFRCAVRIFLRNPGFALVAIISLALGIGANSAIFTLADGLLLRPMPVPDASRLIAVQSQLRGAKIGGIAQYSGLSYPDYRDLRDRSKSFSGLAATAFEPFGFAVDRTAIPKMEFGNLVSGNFFSTLAVRPELGRFFRDDEDQVRGRDAVAVLSWDLWHTEFGGSPDVVGRVFYLNGIPFTVVGVAPQKFSGPYGLIRSAIYVPFAIGPRLSDGYAQQPLDNRSERSMFVYGRLKPEVSLPQAIAESGVIGQQLAQSYPQTNKGVSLVAATERQAALRRSAGNAIIVVFLMVLSSVVLLIACANVINLLLSHAQSRSREIAVRLAVGAGRGRLIRQLLTESLIMSLLGGALGLLLAQSAASFFSRIQIPSDIPLVMDFRLNANVLLFTLTAAVLSAVLVGLIPAWQFTKTDLLSALKSGKAGSVGKRRGRNALVVVQVAGSFVLLVFATQAYRGASIVLSSPLGFRTDHLLLASFDPRLARYTPDQTQQFYKQLLERTRSLPGVRTTALAKAVPLAAVSGGTLRLVPDGVQLPPGADVVSVPWTIVSDHYFETMGVRFVEGRDFQTSDGPTSPQVAIVNERFAKDYFPNRSAVGRRFRLNGQGGPIVEIVGVARDAKYAFPVEPPTEYVYLPLAQNAQSGMTLLLYTSAPSTTLVGPLKETVRSLDAAQPIIGLRTMEEFFDQRARQLLDALLEAIGAIGALGLVLALIGIYGLISYSVAVRQREIGIRMALGAQPSGLLLMVLNEGIVLAGAGVLIGLAFSLVTGRLVTAAIGTSSLYLPLLLLVMVTLLGIVALGLLVPARRAARLDPNVVLKQD